MRKSLLSQIQAESDRAAEWSPLEEGIFSEARKQRAAVVGIGKGAGATFVAANLAYYMAKSADGVCYIDKESRYLFGAGSGGAGQAADTRNGESNERYAYRSIPLERVLSRNRAVDYFEAEQQGAPYGYRRNLYANVNWVVHLPKEDISDNSRRNFYGSIKRGLNSSSDNYDVRQAERIKNVAELRSEYIYPPAGVQGFALRGGDGLKQERIPGRYLILDEPPITSLTEAELVICVLDPLPSRLHSGMEKLICLRDNRIKAGRKFSPVLNLPTPVIWVLNKDNSQVSHRELEQFLKIRFDFVLPLLDERIFYRAEYSGVPIFKLPDFTQQGQAEFERLAKQVLNELHHAI